MSKGRIIFMGTPEFAATHLEALVRSGRNIVAAYTRPDKPKGRGRHIEFTPVKAVATEHGIPVRQPASFSKDPDAGRELAELKPDLLVVVAYGLILPQAVLDSAIDGGWNVHASLLPAYRGAAPINRAVENGEKTTGVTLMQMNAQMDAGDAILAKTTDIGPEETVGELRERLAKLGVEALLEGLKLRDEGKLSFSKQDESKITTAPPIKKEDLVINWEDRASKIHDKIRALSPKPGAHSGDLKIYRSKVAREAGRSSVNAGVVIAASKDGIEVETGDGSLLLVEVQPAGGKIMRASDYAHGRHVVPGNHI